jgi:hypothetical protein
VGDSKEVGKSGHSKSVSVIFEFLVYFLVLPFSRKSFIPNQKTNIQKLSNYIPLKPSDWNNIKDL